jgi:metal-responsive CopG/Arc/MetJ family transcriptional regulator
MSESPPAATRRVYVHLPVDVINRLDLFSAATARDRSSSIRYAILRMLKSWDEDGGGA